MTSSPHVDTATDSPPAMLADSALEQALTDPLPPYLVRLVHMLDRIERREAALGAGAPDRRLDRLASARPR
ncbi:hypothetical protein [Alsobacter sp. SYSU BS001988]